MQKSNIKRIIIALLLSSNLYTVAFLEQESKATTEKEQIALLHSREKRETLSCYILSLFPILIQHMNQELGLDTYETLDTCSVTAAHLLFLIAGAKNAHIKYALYKKHKEDPRLLGLKSFHSALPFLVQYGLAISGREDSSIEAALCNGLLAVITALGYTGYDIYEQFTEKNQSPKSKVGDA